MKLFCETGSEFITNNSPSNPRVGRCNLGCPATPVLSPTAALILPDKDKDFESKALLPLANNQTLYTGAKDDNTPFYII